MHDLFLLVVLSNIKKEGFEYGINRFNIKFAPERLKITSVNHVENTSKRRLKLYRKDAIQWRLLGVSLRRLFDLHSDLDYDVFVAPAKDVFNTSK